MATPEQTTPTDDDKQAPHAALRALPSVSHLLADPTIKAHAADLPPQHLTRIIAGEIDAARKAVLSGSDPDAVGGVRDRIIARLRLLLTPKLRPLINATGVILHTNLGRAPVSAATTEAMNDALARYTPLELDLATGGRGGRMAEIEALLGILTRAEAALVVNNNAAATTLTLAALAIGRQVILSRGEAVEIGGGFRIPDVMRQSGAALIEVGTTNRTYARDYEAAITGETAALLKVHASNFRVIGFTHEATIAELAALGQARSLPLIHDIGSGALRDTAPFGLGHEPTVPDSLRDGASVVLFSGDKLLGGPQAGIIAGDRALIARIARHPLARAVRADKATLAGIAATLRHYLRGEELTHIPVWRMIAAPADDLRVRAERWQAVLAEHGIASTVIPAHSTVGGGSLPEETLPTWALAFDATALSVCRLTPDTLATALRSGDPPIVARIAEDRLLLDPRTVFADEEAPLLARLTQALTDRSGE
jgi:L-seryl-tRNA(Ser) seleniumtransferase